MAYKQSLEDWRSNGKIRKLWASEPSLWSDKDEGKWGGWAAYCRTGISGTSLVLKPSQLT